jgi:hypothetical protein
MNKKFNGFISLLSMLVLVMIACGSSAEPTNLPAKDVAALAENASTSVPTSAPTEAVQPTATVQHVMVPGELPDTQSGLAGDQDSSITAGENRAPGGDRFTYGRYERPFNNDAMDIYYPYLDIQTVEFYQDDTWLYGVITLKADESSLALSGKYGFEIDLDVDGGGDWLIMAVQPSSTEWTTTGAQVWFDEDDDVGGNFKVNADNSSTVGTGYETMIFGDGQGNDPDLAWVRISPTDPNTVYIAAKLSLLEGDKTFLVGMWAGNDDFAPALFDMNDALTHEQAGAPLKELEYFYPVKELSELDNVCRMAVGFQPIGNEPGLCPQPPRPDQTGGPGEPGEETGCPPQYVVCFNFGNQTVCYCNQP